LVRDLKSSDGWLAFDTETTGLHLKADMPFLLTISIEGHSYAIDLQLFTDREIQMVFDAFNHFEFVMGHNVKYDLHMMRNYGVTYNGDNLTDTMIIARLSLETDAVMSLALKQLAKKYLSSLAGDDEKVIKSRLTALRRAKTAELKVLLKEYNWTKKKFDKILKNTLFETSDLGELEAPWLVFEFNNPEPNYLDVYNLAPKTMLEYAMNDTEITLDLAKKMYPVLIAKDQERVFKIENSIILPLFRMESVGLNIDREYLETSRVALKKLIEEKRKLIKVICEEDITVNQHKRIKEIFVEKWGIELTSSDKKSLQTVQNNDEAILFARTVSELKSLEKWYSTYILKLQRGSEYDGRAYTQINQATDVTGRVSSDFQQFPKHALYYANGDELFHPRKMVIPTGGKFDSIYYLDYSQIELRVQANYTYLISGGDLNMCRAYMPHECLNEVLGDFNPNEHKQYMFTKDWFEKETGKKWHPVDLHSATTMQAFPDVDPTSPEFKKLRALGKSTNFAKNYGATTKALVTQFNFDLETAEALNQGYYDAFPKILDYQNLVRKTYAKKGYVKNMYGRRYYLLNSRFAYKLYNYIVQGTSADLLKEKIYEVDKLLLPYHSNFQMNIHDELSFEIYKGEEFLVQELKEIMEDVDWMTIPVVADPEVTYTNWAEKEDLCTEKQ